MPLTTPSLCHRLAVKTNVFALAVHNIADNQLADSQMHLINIMYAPFGQKQACYFCQ